MDLVTGKKVSEKGLVKRVVKDLVEPFDGSNHVLYCDNYYSSGPLVEELARKKIYFAGTIRKNAKGFPESLKSVKLSKDTYIDHTHSIEWVWLIRANAGCHEHRRSKFALMNIQN